MHATVAPTLRVRTLAAAAALALVAVGLAMPKVPAEAIVRAAPVGAAVAPSALAAAGQGLVPGGACSGSGSGTAACALWAKPGTLALSGATPDIWGFAAAAADPAQTPGPVLVVSSGDSVSLTVHNGLADPLSMAVPGVRLTTVGAPAAGEDTVGAAAGADASYTFTAPGPGTYLYEAGHTALGARQVAMGLVGALVVRPAGFDELAPTQDGTAATGFEDEAVLVLSEVDPAFNAAPRTYDLRRFHASYRLINGKAYPSTQEIATNHGSRTLLRYVNAGLAGHAMGVLGAKQEVLAVSVGADHNRSPLVSDMIPAGQTEDVRVTFPAAGADQLPVYETAGTLDNAGQVAGPGTQRIVGFGGMLTFLVADGTPPTTDTVGPSVSGVAVAPNPATPLAPATVTATATDPGSPPTGGSTIAQAEFFVDTTSIVVGGASPMSPTDGAFDSPSEGVTGTLSMASIQTLTQGQHTMFVRAMDAAGNWGPASSFAFTVGNTGPSTTGLSLSPNPTNGSVVVALSATGNDSSIGGKVTAGEYFVDGTGASATGTAVNVAAPATVVSGTATLSMASLGGLAEGKHTVSVHFRDDSNLWGPFATIDLVLDRTGPALGGSGNAVTPNPTDGTTGDPVDPTSLKVHATFVDPVSPVPPAPGVSSPVKGAEGFLDNPSGVSGTGFAFVADDGSWNSTSEAGYGLIPLSQLNGLTQGTHTVYVHGRDAAGNWGTLAPITFVLDRGPTVAAGSPGSVSTLAGLVTLGTATSANSTIAAAEAFESIDPGKGNGSALVVTPTGAATASLRIEPRSLNVGTHVLWVRAKAANGIWGKAVAVQITVTGLFSDGFEAGNTSAWSSQSGGAGLVNAAAAVDGSFGFEAGTNSYVQRDITSSTNLHMAFKLRPGNLVTGSAGVPVLQGRNGNNTWVSVLYRNTGSGPQVMLTAQSGTGGGGGTTLTTGWTSLTPTGGVADLRLDWPSGTANWGQNSTRAVTLSANGVQVLSLNVNRGNRTVSSIRLGVMGTATSGRLHLDSFGATN